MNFKIENYIERTPRVTKHILFWMVYVSFFTMLYGSFDEDYTKRLGIQLLYLPELMVSTYIVIYIFVPKFLLQRKYGAFFALLASFLLLAGFVHWATALYLEQPIFWADEDWNAVLFYPAKIIKSITYIYPVVAIAVVIKLFKRWYGYQQAAQQLKQEKLEAELKFLKAQIHPHFLFNTLNNLYALTLKKSEIAPDVVLRLSDLLNYMLYECNAKWIQLKQEVELLENYIALEKIRYGGRLDIQFDVSGDVEAKMIAPMLILPFVENSFKHGVSEEINDAWVKIDLELDGSEMILKVDNSKSNLKAEDEQDYRAGIGLTNVKRRLELLYGDHHELQTTETEDSYLIILKLTLENGN